MDSATSLGKVAQVEVEYRYFCLICHLSLPLKASPAAQVASLAAQVASLMAEVDVWEAS